ncbi:hypothetical protein KFL_000070110 [Klebsormidium nitens]|uniref:Uncharacterized protein n=1 Tax=Klebsormidium nitens TaxID=105231 RepID=A0A1Y1HM28_KLENI|nr:hypothetical protein KFL_000070110 [Klebsormidium nitens]|eukprot:GAQ78041.1 hypothetical protein KFL_000070110 [Klebsormidium nitens]
MCSDSMDFFSAARGGAEGRNRRVGAAIAVAAVAGLYFYGRNASPKNSTVAQVMEDASRGGTRPSSSRQENSAIATPYEAATVKNAPKQNAGNVEALKVNPGGNPGARPSLG